jgi:class 3 adenylate cyclase/tetratricopeptide (TPR) repeat protein
VIETVKNVTFEPYLPRLVVDWSRDPDAGGVRELDGSLVSLDVSGFTRLSERLQANGRAGAEELVLLISGVHEGLIGISERHGGDVLKFRGDALLLLFSGAGHEQRACVAASQMQWLIEQTGQTMSSVGPVDLRMHAGVYSGPCWFFLVESTHRELMVTGPAATETIRLESAAAAGEVLVSERTAEALERGRLGEAREQGRLLLPSEADIEDDDVSAHAAEPSRMGRQLELYVPVPLRAQLVLEAGEAEHRQVTAAFLKFSGVDAVLAADAEEAHRRLSDLAQLVGDATAELGLTWLESDIDVDGGKVYLAGGAPSSTGADEERMLRALRGIVDEYEGLTLRAGVNRGPAFCGDVGAATRRTYAVMGDTVNLAARLTGRAGEREILATADVLDRSRTRFDTQPKPLLVKGKERSITAYSVGPAAGEKEEEPAVELPLVGREAELAAFDQVVNAGRMRQQRVIELVGQPGIGKSRLVEELQRRAVGFSQLAARCDPYSVSRPYFVLRSLLRPLAGITPDSGAQEAGGQLAPWVQAVLPDLAPWLPLLAIPFGAEVAPTPETEQIDPAFRRTRLHQSVEQFLERVLMMPTLIVLEDSHWMDDASWDLIRHLTRDAAARPWVICVTRRPQGGELARDVEGHLQLALEPLDRKAAQALALAAAGELPLSGDALQAVGTRSGGNPLFVRELVAAARAAGSVDALPETVETLITTRIDTLAPEDRFLLRNASVLGARFELDLLSEVVAEELAGVNELDRWERLSEFVMWEGAGELRFVHDLFRAVAYEGLSYRRRRDIHERVGAALQRRGADPALLSLHFFRAEDYARSWIYSVEAGTRAKADHANIVAAELFERALDAAEKIDVAPTEVAGVAEALGDVCELAAQYERAASAYARARSVGADDPRLLLKEGVLRERLGKYPDALNWYGRGLQNAAPATKIELELAFAGVKYRQGQYDEAIEWGKRAAADAEAAGDRVKLAHAFYLQHIAHTDSGRRETAHRDEALTILEEVGDLVRLSSLQNNIGIEAYYDGRWDEAIDWYRRSGETARRVGDVVNVARAQNNEGEILSDQGRLDEASVLFQEARRTWRAAQYPIGIALATSNLGRAAARGGEFAEAYRLHDQSLDLFEQIGAEAFVLEARSRKAECLVLEGRFQEALELLGPLLEDASAAGQRAAVERLAGYALVQSRAPFEEARSHFEASEAAADAAHAQYELALTRRAVAETSGAGSDAEADAVLESLGVIRTASVPLP